MELNAMCCERHIICRDLTANLNLGKQYCGADTTHITCETFLCHDYVDYSCDDVTQDSFSYSLLVVLDINGYFHSVGWT